MKLAALYVAMVGALRLWVAATLSPSAGFDPSGSFTTLAAMPCASSRLRRLVRPPIPA